MGLLDLAEQNGFGIMVTSDTNIRLGSDPVSIARVRLPSLVA